MLRSYFKHIRGIFLYLLLCCGIFALVFALLGLPLIPVAYALALCAAAGLPAALVGFLRRRKKHRLLSQLDLRDSMDNLPAPSDAIEADYQTLLRQLFQENQAQKAAADQRYEDTLDYFTLWAHQIKTPISGMDLILQAGEGPAYSELKNELFRVQQYVSMALGYLRLGAKISDFVFGTYDLDAIVRSAIRAYAGQFIRNKSKISYEPIQAQVLTDEKWLGFVIEQLLSNALKYAPGGTVTITLEPDCVLCISDDGIGIAQEDLPRIFEKGYTGYNGRRNRRTTGIGLYLCHEIITRLGHTISVTSAPGQGTTVRLDLSHRPLELDQ